MLLKLIIGAILVAAFWEVLPLWALVCWFSLFVLVRK